jgi:hypothetical protein
MRVTWIIVGAGVGGRTVEDVEEAVQAVQGAVRESLAPHPPEVAAKVLHGAWGPLRAALVTDGRMAVSQGRSWSSSSGGISVELLP